MSATAESTPPQLPGAVEAHPGDSAKSTPSPPSGDRPFNVYVKNFTAEVNDEKLHAMFEEFGTIQSCTVLHDHLGKSKLVGFVQFSSDAEAKKAVQEMHCKTGLGGKPLHVALTNKKPVNSRRRSGLSYYAYEYTPFRQPMYNAYPMSSPDTPPTPSHTSTGSPHHPYPSMPMWPSSGAVQVVFMPYNPYSYNKQHQPVTATNRPAARGSAQKTYRPLSSTGLYTGPQNYNEQYYPGHYYTPGSPAYDPYPAFSSAYAGYNAGWGTPYHPYSTHPASSTVGYGYA